MYHLYVKSIMSKEAIGKWSSSNNIRKVQIFDRYQLKLLHLFYYIYLLAHIFSIF